MKIQHSCRVELGYTIHDVGGNVVDSSDQSGPLVFVHGSDEVPAALAAALEGKEVGDAVEVAFGPGEAFGEFNPEGIVSVPREEIPDDVELEIDQWITVTVTDTDEAQDEGGELEMRVVEVTPEAVVLDANHPLANEPVTFKVKVTAVTAG